MASESWGRSCRVSAMAAGSARSSGQLSRRPASSRASVCFNRARQSARICLPEPVVRLAFARQPFKMLGQLLDLEEHRPRIFVVEQHEIEHRREVRQQVVARAEGDGTVRHFEHGLEHAGILRLGRMQRGVEQRAQINARVRCAGPCRENARPARGSCSRAPGRETRRGRAASGSGRPWRRRRACTRLGRRRGQPVVELAQHAPHVVGGAVAHEHRQPLQMVHDVAQTAGAVRIKNGRQQFRFERLGVLPQLRPSRAMPGNCPWRSSVCSSGASSGIAPPVAFRD